jgi:hypothetical protein
MTPPVTAIDRTGDPLTDQKIPTERAHRRGLYRE